MSWIRERVWQMGIGALLVLIGSWLAYQSAVNEPVNNTMMWFGLALIFIGLLVPLVTYLLEADQENNGKRGKRNKS